MKLYRLPLPFFVLLVPAAAHCEPAEEAPPPATAENVATAGTAPGEPPAPPPPYSGDTNAPPDTAVGQGGGAAGTDSAQPGDVAIGEDSDSYQDDDPAALTDFRTTLDPYGAWADDPTYGTVWVPSTEAVGEDFRPYATAGHWDYDSDWVWASDYPWGWAPFHYGRWVFIEGRGWSWIPGRTYRGAWVDWSVDDGYGYLGWAPAPPLFIWFGGAPIGWRRGYLAPRWVYCPRRDVFAPAVGARILVGPAAVALNGHMRLYATASARVAGPAPARYGYTAAQVPRPTGEAQVHLGRAQAFARPSTAQPLGARSPAPLTRGAQTVARPAVAIPGRGFGSSGPVQRAPAHPPMRSPAAPAPRAPSGAGGGGRFGGGGGGHHR